MIFFMNELSIHGQFHTQDEFLNSLKNIILMRQEINKKGLRLLCHNNIIHHFVYVDCTFLKAISKIPDKALISYVLSWLSKEGPYWDQNEIRQHSSDEYFTYSDEVITDSSLAEAAYRTNQKQSLATISIEPSKFNLSPVLVEWYQNTDQMVFCPVINYWDLHSLLSCLKAIEPPIDSWEVMLDRATNRFTSLIFFNCIIERLNREPFNQSIAYRIMELLTILNELKSEINTKKVITDEARQLLENYFWRTNALFTDESESNKRVFKKELTFRKNNGQKIFCSYHGKISQQCYRIHFSWPINQTDPLYIAYIGPKITKE